MLMKKRNRNRTGKHHAAFCTCCDVPPSGIASERRRAKRRERRAWRKEAGA
jgi:hypothetical protein